MNRALVAAGSAIGAAALLGAVVVALFEPALPSLALVGTDWVVFAGAGGAIALGLVGVLLVGAASEEGASLPPREAGPTRRHKRVTESIDRSLERLEPGETAAETGRRSYQRRQARAAIRETVASVLAERHDVSEAEAARRLRDGSWTDDPRAASFASREVPLALRLRLEDWAYGARYQRGLAAAIAAVEALDADSRSAPADASATVYDSSATPDRQRSEPASGPEPERDAEPETEPEVAR